MRNVKSRTLFERFGVALLVVGALAGTTGCKKLLKKGLQNAMADAGTGATGTGSSGGTAAKGPDPSLSDEEYCAALAKQEAEKPSVADAIPGGRLLGRFGRKKDTTPSDPRCANLKKK